MQKNMPALRAIYFHLTDGCNLCCRHCWIDPKSRAGGQLFLPLDIFISVIKEAKELGLQSVKLTGGEPLLHPDLGSIIDHVVAEDLRLIIETNGILMTEALAGKIKKCKNHHVTVSLDGVNAETHEWMRGVDGSFEKAIKGIQVLKKAGLRFQIIMTIMRRNRDQLEGMVRLAESLGAYSIKFNIIQPLSRGEAMHETGDNLSIEELVELGGRVENELSGITKLQLHYSHPLSFRPLVRIFKGKEAFITCDIFGILGVLASGSYALCGIGETVSELVFGSAGKDALSEVWRNNEVLNQIREGLPERLEGVCSKCLMKKLCLGNCVAGNYYKEKNIWAPFWYCEEAYVRGLFPESRLRPEKINKESITINAF